MKIKYECVEVRKYVGCEIVVFDICNGRRVTGGDMTTALSFTFLSKSDGIKQIDNPEWGRFVPGKEYYITVDLVPTSDLAPVSE